MLDRRDLLARGATVAGLLVAAGLWPATALARWNQPAFEARTLADLIKALGSAAPVESQDVTLSGPDLAENGAVVPVAVACSLPGVRRLLILIEKNPALLAADFSISDAIEPSVKTRVKMSQSSRVIALAMLDDGRLLFAQKDIKVTLGGCGG